MIHRLALAVIVVVILPQLLSAQGLDLSWNFDDGPGSSTAADSSGNGRTGTLTNMDTAGDWVAGRTGQSGDFSLDFAGSLSGSDDFVAATGYKGPTGTTSRTVSAWINSGATNSTIASWGDNVSDQKWVFRTNSNNGTAETLRVEVNGGYQVGSTDIVGSGWTHVLATWENDGTPNVNDVRLYVNGVLEANSATQGNAINTASSQDVYFGGESFADRDFLGQIDEAAIWSEALTADEVQGLYDVATESTLFYDPSLFDELKQIHDAGAGAVEIDGLLWSYVGSGLTPGLTGSNGSFALGLDGTNGSGLQSAVIPEPASVAIWSLIGLGLVTFGCMRRRRKS